MKKRVFILLILTVLFVVFSSNSFASGDLSTNPGATAAPASRSSAQPAQADRPSLKRAEQKAERPPTAKIAAQGAKIYLKLDKTVTRVEIRASGKKLGTLGKGSVFDITGYLSKSRADKFEFLFPDIMVNRGTPYSTTLSVARFRTKIVKEQKVKPETVSAMVPAQISIQNIFLKENKIQVQVRKVGHVKFTNQEFMVGKLVVDLQGREISYPLIKLCTLSQLNLGRNLVLDTELVLTEKSRITVGFERIALDRPRTVTLNPVQVLTDASRAKVTKSDGPLVKTVTPRQVDPGILTSPQPNVPPPPPPGPGDPVTYDLGHPDLKIELSINPPNPHIEWHGGIRAIITVTNIGDGTPSAETTVSLWLSDDPYTYYGRMILPFYQEMIPELLPGVEHTIIITFNVPESFKMPGMQESHTIIPGAFRLAAHLNTELLALGEEAGTGVNEAELDFRMARPRTYDLALKSVRLTQDNRLRIGIANEGPDIPTENYEQLRIGVLIDDSNPKCLNMTTVDPSGQLKAAASGWWVPWQSQSIFPFVWPRPMTHGSNGLDPISLEDRHKIQVKVGTPMYDCGVQFSHDTNPANNSKIIYIGGAPDL